MASLAVIGSNSFSGSHFIETVLKKTDYSVIGISRSPERNSAFLPYKDNERGRFIFYQMDLNHDLERIIQLLKKESVEVVVNYAAQGMVGESWNNPGQWFKTNCLSMINLTNELRKMPSLKRYVHISTNEVYGSCNNADENTKLSPSTPYATSKAAADMFIKNLIDQFNFPANIIRSTNVYGPCQELFRIIPKSIICLRNNKKIPLHGGGKAVKSYLYIKDNSDGTLNITQSGRIGQTYHLSPNNGITIEDVVRKICEKLGKDFNKSVEIVEERKGQDSRYILDSSKIRNEFRWKPRVEFDEGLDQCIEWINKNWNLIRTMPAEYIQKP